MPITEKPKQYRLRKEKDSTLNGDAEKIFEIIKYRNSRPGTAAEWRFRWQITELKK